MDNFYDGGIAYSEELQDRMEESAAAIPKSNSTDDIPVQIKYKVINDAYSLKSLLEGLGVKVGGSNIYCPFHPDEDTGKPSAKYHPDTDLLYCFSESKVYSAYHAIKLLYMKDIDAVFRELWGKMTPQQQREVMTEETAQGIIEPPGWTQTKRVWTQFSLGAVTFKQHKNALYKILTECLNPNTPNTSQSGG